LIAILIALLLFCGNLCAQTQTTPQTQANTPADALLHRGLALAQSGDLNAADTVLRTGMRLYPRDARFWEEHAGIAYQQKHFSTAQHALRHALALNPQDDYANNFLGSLYFLQDNLEAALFYWNRVGKPVLDNLAFAPQLHLHPLLLDRAFNFAPRSVWSLQQYRTTEAQLDALNLFPSRFYELLPQPDGSYGLVVHASQRPSWRQSKLGNLTAFLRSLPYQAVDPEFYNLNGKGLNWRSYVRWDDEKRMLTSTLALPTPVGPQERLRLYFDGRNENWLISNTLTPAAPALASLNVERAVAGLELRLLQGWRWQESLAAEYSTRNFRSLSGIPAAANPFFTSTSGISVRLGAQAALLRIPQNRFTLTSSATAEVERFFTAPLGRAASTQASLLAHWLPQARGEDYETTEQVRAGGTFGTVPFDDLSMLGFDRDNPLWMRGHFGLVHGKKGNAPLGRNYILSNTEVDKLLYHAPWARVQIGPFLDTGNIWDGSAYFGARGWMTDSGVQATLGAPGGFRFFAGYGRDLRSGGNVFYTTVTR
jgi:hypothetical protein